MNQLEPPQILTRKQVREFDRIAVNQYGIPSIVLMENAARGAADEICKYSESKTAVILCGSGNNGGDGMAIARHLHLRKWRCSVILLFELEKLTGDARVNYGILMKTTVPIINGLQLPIEDIALKMQGHAWIIDAILGTGAKPPLRSPIDKIVQIANQQKARRMAIDIATGLDCDQQDTDQENGVVFNADLTATFVAKKPVMATSTGIAHSGEIKVVDIGAPPEIYNVLTTETPTREE